MTMQMKLFFVLTICLAILSSACGDSNTPANGSNTNVIVSNANANIAQKPANASALDPTKKPEGPTTNDAPTLTPVVNTFREALRKKDDALVKSVMSQEFIKLIEDEMKADGKKGSIAAFMAEVETDLDKPVEVRNEKIEGNKGVAELKGGVNLTWTPFEFVNEGGKWKFTGGSPVLK